MANEFKVKKGLIVDGSGTVVDIQGTEGQLFSVTDSLTGDLFSVSDVSGVPILNVNSSGAVTIDGYIKGQLKITGDGDNAVTFTESGNGDFTIDVPDDLRLDFGGSDLVLKAGGTEFSRLTFNNPGLNIQSTQTNSNIYLSPNGTGNVYASTDTLVVTSGEGEAAKFLLRTDEGDDNGDDWYIVNQTSNELQFQNNISGSQTTLFSITPSSNSSTSLASFAGKVSMANGYATSKFAVASSDVHASYDFYNNGTTYLNGATIVDAAFTQSGGDTSTFSGHVTLPDSKEMRFGAGTDLKLYSNGTDGYVVAPVDDLVLQAADNVFIYPQGGEDGIIVRGNDRVDIFYDGAERLRTTADGIKVSKSGNDTTAKVVIEGHNNTGTPGQATSGTIEHRGEHLKTVITHNGSDVITIGTGTQTNFAGDINASGLVYDSTNKYLSISHWASPPTPAAMIHLSDTHNNLDVPQIRIEGRENPGDTVLDIAVKDADVRFNLVEGSTDASSGYGKMHFKTNANANSSHPTRGGFLFQTGAGSVIDALTITNEGNSIFSGAATYHKIQTYYAGDYTSGFKFSDYNGGIWYDAGADDLTLNSGHANSQIILNSGNALTLTLDSSRNATFTGIVNASRFVATGQNLSHGVSRLKISQENTTLSELRFYGANTSTAGALRFMGSSSDGSAGGVRMMIDSSGNVGIGDASPSSISANTFNLSVNSSRSDLTGALINKANGTVKHQQYWDSSGYGFYLSANSGDFKWRVNNEDRMVVDKDGGIDLQGTVGQLFSVTNSLTGDLFSVSDVSGIPILNVNSSGAVSVDGRIGIPSVSTNVKLNVVSTDANWATIIKNYTTGGYGLSVDCSGASSANYVLAACSPSGTGMFLNGSGDVGIGVTAPSNYYADKLVVVDGDEGGITIAGTGASQKQYICFADGTSGAAAYTGHIAYDHDGDTMVFANNGGNARLTIASGGDATFSHDVIAYSDKKLKKNIKTLDGSKVYDMRGVSFTRKDTGKESSGVIAQELQEIAPELVTDTDGTLGVSYGNLTGYLIEAIKELKAEIEELKKQIK